MCESHFRSLVIETPRYECESVSCNIDWPSVYWWVDFVLECETFRTKHFLALNCICQLSCHSESVFKSVCKRSTSESSWMGRYITQSSANKRTSDVILSGRSFIYAKNKRGPRTVPWGTPDLTCTHCEWSPSTTTRCRRLVRKFEIQVWVLPVIPKFCNLWSNLLCGTVSNALLKSIIIISTGVLASMDLARSLTVRTSWDSQEWFARNPCCLSVRIWCSEKCLMMLLCSMCSKSLQQIGVKDTGL